MFFNLGPFHFQITSPKSSQNSENESNLQERNDKLEEQTENHHEDRFGGLDNFFLDNFMNPSIQPNTNQRQQELKSQNHRPSFVRSGTKRETQKESSEEKDESKNIELNENTGVYWKEKANVELKHGRLEAALKCYDQAILLNNTESIFFSNRARCLKKMGNLDLALEDAQSAIELDNENIKGYFLCGQILAEIGKQTKDIGKVSNSLIMLTKALTLSMGKLKFTKLQSEIGIFIYRVKKLLWHLKFEEIKERRILAIGQYKNYLEQNKEIDEETATQKLNEFIGATDESIIFQIPDFLICRITLDLMEDPVITDSGQAYEREAIIEHIERNGKTDPFTREPISGILYPCIAIRNAIEEFLEKNPWAYEFTEGETYKDINF